jgi:glycosyltransferase involved in cell wall biosynthesis
MQSAHAAPRPVALIPAYKPEPAVVGIATELSASGRFQAVICVDDGSGLDYRQIFEQLEQRGIVVLRHFVNLGKGMALRTGINHIACTYLHTVGIVTLDADGQHLAKDVCAVAEALQQHPTSLIMGCRQLPVGAPLRSRFGNLMTRHVIRFCTGMQIGDTQTGLRGIPMQMLPDLLRQATNGYDFETEMLVNLGESQTRIVEVPISAVYIDDNRSSSFRPLRDSIAIYFVFVRHVGNALLTALLDYVVFAAALMLGKGLGISLIAGRVVAGLFNYYVGKTFVFKSKHHALRGLLAYTALVAALATISYFSISFMVSHTGIPPLLAKLLVESVIFFASFAIQRVYIFGSDSAPATATDWERYYTDRTTRGSPTRKITQQLLLSFFGKYATPPVKTITEFGGGDSCFFAAIRKHFPAAFYLAVDKSARGVQRFIDTNKSNNCSALEADLLANPEVPASDVVFSVGLIEHFEPHETAKIIESHFRAASPGGLVIITYPTPTVPYRIIRTMAELLGIWRFHDERPLLFNEVEREIVKHGRVLHRKMNWWIGLTQEIVVVRNGLASGCCTQTTTPECAQSRAI